MKFRTIMIATAMIAATVATASAESVYEPTGSAVHGQPARQGPTARQGQTAQEHDTIRYFSSGRAGHATAGSNRSTHDAFQGGNSPHGQNDLLEGHR